MSFNKKICSGLGKAIGVFTFLSGSIALAQTNAVQCIDIDDDAARLACYDQGNNRTATTSPVLSLPSSSVPIAAPVKREVATQPDQVLQAKQSNRNSVSQITEDNFGLELKIESDLENDNMRTLTVASARHNDFTGWTIKFKNGQVWKQVGTDTYRIRVGQTVTMKRAAFNSFLLGNLENRRKMRVSRVE